MSSSAPAATAADEVQTLLRLLTKDAKIPLADALPAVGRLRKAQLNNVENISKASLADLTAVFPDEKLAKQVSNAAKRVRKKRSAGDLSQSSPSKRLKEPSAEASAATDDEFQLPETLLGENDLSKTIIQTNRAPLVLAFAVAILKYTMPEQPLSSRLSLAQAVVSANSQSKAKSIGITNESTAEEEGWGRGQPRIKVMGRDVAVMRRATLQTDENASRKAVEHEEGPQENHTAFWGLDLEALRKSNGPLVAGKNSNGQPGLPIHTPQAARGYLLRSISVVESPDEPQNLEQKTSPSIKKPTAKEMVAKKEEAAAMLLKAIDLLCSSWSSSLSKVELDRRSWSWYLHVRPEVQQGQAGWGQKGLVSLGDILKLRREKH